MAQGVLLAPNIILVSCIVDSLEMLRVAVPTNQVLLNLPYLNFDSLTASTRKRGQPLHLGWNAVPFCVDVCIEPVARLRFTAYDTSPDRG